jgi:hypothetical protein
LLFEMGRATIVVAGSTIGLAKDQANRRWRPGVVTGEAMSRHMLRALSFPLLLLIAPCGPAASKQAEPVATAAPAAREGVVQIYMSSTRPLAILRVGGLPAPVVFDTGTTSNGLDSTFVAAAGLKELGASSVLDGATGESFPAVSVSLHRSTGNKTSTAGGCAERCVSGPSPSLIPMSSSSETTPSSACRYCAS